MRHWLYPANPKYYESPFTFSWLRQNGLKGSIMGPQCLENNEQLFKYIVKIESI